MSITFDFAGKVALVTGVARVGQIGHALALAFGRAGATIVAADRNAVAVSERVREFREQGMEARPAAGDLTDRHVADLAVENAVRHYGRLDILVNVAGGLTTYGPLRGASPDGFDREVAINLKTAFLMSLAAAPALTASRGCIVNFASVSVIHPSANLAIYSAAKAGVAGLTRSLAEELRPEGVRVNAVAPAMVRTGENIETAGAGARYVEMSDITTAVLFLASDDARAVTGHLLPLTNGGD
ncbi:MAG: SDR family NAD(P)-dependent oxidoreductase [Gemmatimonadales bacterium]